MSSNARRARLALLAFVVAIVIGLLLGPIVFGRAADGGTPLRPEAATIEAATSASPSPSPTPTTVEPTPSPSAEVSALTPQQEADLLAGVLGYTVPNAGSGELQIIPGTTPAPEGTAPVSTVRVEVEAGLDIDGAAFAAFVMAALNDPRSWGGDGSIRFERTDGEADIRVVLATPTTVDMMCAPLATNNRWSCGRYGHAALNAERWVLGSAAFLDAGGSLTEYRQYLVNHEVGHLLGHQHVRCPAAGAVAPVMVQQSISVQGCLPNGWPYP